MLSDLSPRDDGNIVLQETTEIHLREFRIAADIGILSHEIGRKQALVITIILDAQPPESDEIAQTIDYNHLAAAATMLAGERISLIETFARRLALACLAMEGVRRANVYVEKPSALTNGLAATRVILSRAGLSPGQWQA